MKQKLMIFSLSILLVGIASWTMAGVRKPTSAVKAPPATEKAPAVTSNENTQGTGSDVVTSPSTSPEAVDVTAPSREAEAPSPTTEDNTALPIIEDQQATSGTAAYEIKWQALTDAGGVTTSSSYEAFNAIGGPAVGEATSSGYEIGSGFVYGAMAEGEVTCQCNCHGDPAPIGSCDGSQDVLDVVQTVNVAFRGAAPIPDPNGQCPYQATDTNCSNSTDVIDVVKMVNVAFRGANRATEFCDPCP
jgi:hypothetical protein